MSINAHPILIPHKIIAYRRVVKKGQATEQVLVEWVKWSAVDCSWEELEVITWIAFTLNLEAKVQSDAGGDVTIGLNLEEVTKRLQEELNNRRMDQLIWK